MTKPAMDTAERGSVTAWDLPTRLFHWLLVALVVAAWVSFRFSESFGDYLLKWHRWNGLAILTLLAWRILWGLAGPPTARFSSFVKGPSAALAYGRDLFSDRHRRFLGHNPLGGLMVIALLGALVCHAALGLFSVDDNGLTGGPFSRLLSANSAKAATAWHHHTFHRLLLPLFAIHIAANLLYGLVKKEPLIPAMITGRKPAADYEDAGSAQHRVERPLLRAALLLVAAALIVLGSIRLIAGKLV